MRKYNVSWSELTTTWFEKEVEAENEDEAFEVALGKNSQFGHSPHPLPTVPAGGPSFVISCQTTFCSRPGFG